MEHLYRYNILFYKKECFFAFIVAKLHSPLIRVWCQPRRKQNNIVGLFNEQLSSCFIYV